MTDKKYKYWLAVVDGQPVQFSELPHLMATAMHPECGMAYGAARINLEDELKLAVRDGLLRVRNPAGLGFHTFPHGDALQRAVLIPDTDLDAFLNERGIELRITPHGNGPDYWTLEHAAAAMQEQLHWHDGTRADFQEQMQEAAGSRALVVLNPRTCLPYFPERVRTFWEYVTPDSVNAWLATLKAPYRWNPAPPLVTVGASHGVEPDKAGSARPLQRTAAQDSAILCEIEKQGYDPLALPKNLPGKSGVKAAIRAALSQNSLFTGGTIFDKAWERLTARADIAIQG